MNDQMNLEGTRVLAVDDEPDVLETLHKMSKKVEAAL